MGLPCVRYGDLYTTHESFISQTRSYVSLAKASAYTPINRGDISLPYIRRDHRGDWQIGSELDAHSGSLWRRLDHIPANSSNGSQVCGLHPGLPCRADAENP